GQPVADRRWRVEQSEDIAAERGGSSGSAIQLKEDPLEEGAVGIGGGADHTGSRRSGSDMQRGPPPPRASSLPSMVITVRCLASVQSSKARKFAAGSTRNPAATKAHRVCS